MHQHNFEVHTIVASLACHENSISLFKIRCIYKHWWKNKIERISSFLHKKKHVYENKYHSIRLYSLGLHFLLITWPCVIVQWFTVWNRLSLGCCFQRCCQGRCNSWWRALILSQPLQQFSWAMASSAYQLEHWMKKKMKRNPRKHWKNSFTHEFLNLFLKHLSPFLIKIC